MSRRGQRTVAHQPKVCAACGETFAKRSKYSLAQWEQKRFCSNSCHGIYKRRDAVVDSDGYVHVWVGDSLRLRSHVVIEQRLGRRLMVGEVVDHINGVRDDDRPENLRVFPSQADHMRAHWSEGTIRPTTGAGGALRYRDDGWAVAA